MLKSSSEIQQIEFDDNYKFKAFVCQDEENTIDKGTKSWIDKFVTHLIRMVARQYQRHAQDIVLIGIL